MSATPALLLVLAVLLSGCGDDESADERVGPDVDGSGQQELLRAPTFRNAVQAIGVPPSTRPVPRLGRRIGRRLRMLTLDTGRLVPANAFLPGPYRRLLERRGRLSDAAFRRRYGQGPREMCDRIGALVGQLEWRLDEGADPEPELARAVLAGYGRGRTAPEPDNRITSVRDQLGGRLPNEGPANCVGRFQSSYLFVGSLYGRA